MINVLPQQISSSSIYLFADDTKIFKHVKDECDSHALQKDLDNLLSWSSRWLLKFHPDKCCVLSIGNQVLYDYTMHHDGILYHLAHVDSSKDLGVIVDSKLNFDQHFQSKINTAKAIEL